MKVNGDQQIQQCFIDQQFEQSHHQEDLQLKIEIKKRINEDMPANQLRTARRPENMAPRTFYLDRPFYLLRDEINQPYDESITDVQTGRVKNKILNSKNLAFEHYFSKKKFKPIYNKLETYRSDITTFLGKLKGIDSLVDYNWKCFKQLEIQINLLNQNKEDRIDSDFQSGNICKVYSNLEVQEKEYYLLIQNDLNTYGYNHWFFFRLRNKETGVRRFVIPNFIKRTNFFSQGMLISIFSLQKCKNQNIGWFKGGNNITFSQVNLLRHKHENQYYYSLYFEYNFEYDCDQVYFALNQPYTYTRLVNSIQRIKQKSKTMQIFHDVRKMQVKTLGYSTSNNIIPVIKLFNGKFKSDQTILVLARQHPCETVGSFIAEGIMEELIGISTISQYLTSNFQFIIVPMVNPDGVIHGMSRTNMAGLDLNRQWGDNILKELTPQTFKIRNFITNLAKTKNITYMIDLHGHSKKLSSFFFCCKNNEKYKQNYQLLSMAMKKLQNRFNIYSCTYGISKDKENSIRSKINSMGIRLSYTLQTSLYGWKNSQNQFQHFNQSDFKGIAKSLLQSIFLLQADPSLTQQHLNLTKDQLIKELASIEDSIQKQQKKNYENQQIMSDSDPEGDKLDVKDLLGKCQNKLLKKKLQQSLDRKIVIKKLKKFSAIQTLKQSLKKIDFRQPHIYKCQFNAKLTISSTHQTNNFLTDNNFLQKTDVRIPRGNRSKKTQISKRINYQNKKYSENRKQVIESFNLTRPKIRSRLKTEGNSQKKQYIKNNTNRKYIPQKNRDTHIRMASEISPQISHDNYDEFQHSKQDGQNVTKYDKRPSALKHCFKQFKRQRLNVFLLTDTISILKINRKEKLNSENKNIKNVSLEPRQQGHYKTDRPNLLATSNMQTLMTQSKNKQYQQSKGLTKLDKQSHTVFYYFPLL